MSWLTRLLLIILFIPSSSFARGFYFSSSSGNDAYTWDEAQHKARPWKSLAKLNAIINQLQPGDTVYFKSGDIFFGTVLMNASGTPGQPIVFTAYSTGAAPVITGLAKVQVIETGTNNIYAFQCKSCSGHTKILMLDHKLQRFGRYPDSGTIPYSSLEEMNKAGESPINQWLGGELVFRKERWVMNAMKINKDSNVLEKLLADIKTGAPRGFGFFIQKHISTLNKDGEWFYDADKGRGFIYLDDPANKTVEVSTVDRLFSIDGAGNIELLGLAFAGANQHAIFISGSSGVNISKCSIVSSGVDGIRIASSGNISINQCYLDQSLSNGIKADPYSSNVTITRNRIINSGMIAGMGANGNGTYEAIACQGDNSLIEKNYIMGTGYNAIFFSGEHSIVRQNIISVFCQVKDDGAAIYTGDRRSSSQKIVQGNQIDGSHRSIDSTGIQYVEGIYIDDQCRNVLIDGNNVKNLSNCGIKIHNASRVTVSNNFLSGSKFQLELNNNVHRPGYIISEVQVMNNYFYSSDPACNIISLRGVDKDAYRMWGNFFVCRGFVAAYTMFINLNNQQWN